MQPKSETASDPIGDEESVGTEGRGNLHCRVQVDGSNRSFEKRSYAEASPGVCIRVSIGVSKDIRGNYNKVARMLAFVDPLTGKLVVRMGMFDVSKTNKGFEVGPQIVDVSDVPVCDLDTRED